MIFFEYFLESEGGREKGLTQVHGIKASRDAPTKF